MRVVGRVSGLILVGVLGSVGVAVGGGGQRGGSGPRGGNHAGPGPHPGMGHNHGGHGHGQGHGHGRGHVCPGGHAGAGGRGGQGGGGGTGGGAPPPSPCVGSAPPSALITEFSDAVAGDPIVFGTPPEISGGTFSYAAPGLMPPVLAVAPGANAALAVAANPGLPTDAANGYFGFGLFFNSCVDASAYNAVKFTVNGDLGDCSIRFAVTSSQHVSPSDDPRGICTETSGCFPPSTPITAAGTSVVPFFGFTFPGSPNLVDPTSLVGIQWQMDTPPGVACHASFTVDDISFVNAAPPPALSATFDTDTQGWI